MGRITEYRVGEKVAQRARNSLSHCMMIVGQKSGLIGIGNLPTGR